MWDIPFGSSICGKFRLSANYLAERYVFPRIILRNVLTFRELYCGKTCEKAFPWWNPRKVTTFCGLYHGKAHPRGIILRKFRLFVNYTAVLPRKVLTFHSPESSLFFVNISANKKNIPKCFQAFIRGIWGVDSWKKPRLKNLMLLLLCKLWATWKARVWYKKQKREEKFLQQFPFLFHH